MKYPKLVRTAKTPIHITIASEETNEFGERDHIVNGDFLCNYQGKAKTIFTSDKTAVVITGTALIDGDIAPDTGEITGGTVEIFGETREIYTGTKARNPDGTVNYTKLDLT
ncbi:MAG: hypothetical protein PHX61_10885 [Alphaproteobacteria bacterium]|nr:hypothetical protein [Alphaproteobacteria bacterium]